MALKLDENYNIVKLPNEFNFIAFYEQAIF